MYSVDFCYWLQGYFELTEGDQPLTKRQVQVIKNHLHLVFKHEIDDLYEGDKQELQDIHDGKSTGNYPEGQVLTQKPSKRPPLNKPNNDPLIRC